MSRARGKSDAIPAVIAAIDAGEVPERPSLRDAVRELLSELSEIAPGRSVEVRVPPFGAVQCIEGPRHTRGTPPNVIEMDPMTWVNIATGRVAWHEAVAKGNIRSSGIRADLADLVPLPSRASHRPT